MAKCRIVKTCFWADRPEAEYTLETSGIMNDINDAFVRICEDVRTALQTLNDRKYSIDIDSLETQLDDDRFTADFDRDHTCVILFWDGDDYRIVTIFNIYEIDEINSLDSVYWRYRGYNVYQNKSHTRFVIIDKEYNRVGGQKHTLEKALDHIDTLLSND